MSRCFWFEHTIDAYLRACAAGMDWKAACAEAERTYTGPVRVLTSEDLVTIKGIRFSRQHRDKKIRGGTPAAISDTVHTANEIEQITVEQITAEERAETYSR